MVLKCLAWITVLWTEILISHSNSRKDDIRDLPDSVVFDILTRLPTESISNCRRVCKRWLKIISSPHFAKMHLKRAPANFFVQSIEVPDSLTGRFDFSTLTKCKINLFVYEDFHRMEGKFKQLSVVKEIHKASLLVGCCDGTLVFRSGWKYCVCNIVSQEKILIMPPQPLIYFGIVFHGMGREYKLLFHGQKSPDDHQYHIFIYSTQNKIWREVTTFPYPPRSFHRNPVVCSDTLYWLFDSENERDIPCCRNSIIGLKTDSESFHYMNHPGGQCQSLADHTRMSLLEMDGLLCCCVRQDIKLISIWVLLEDRSWVWRYRVDLDLDVKKFPYYSRPYSSQGAQFKLWKIENGELIVYWQFRGLFRIHLQHNTVKEIDFPKLRDYYMCIGCTCTKSVLSLMAGC